MWSYHHEKVLAFLWTGILMGKEDVDQCDSKNPSNAYVCMHTKTIARYYDRYYRYYRYVRWLHMI